MSVFVTKKLDIIADNVGELNKKVEFLSKMLEEIVFKLLTDEKLTKEKKEELFKKYGVISPNVYINSTTLNRSGEYYENLTPEIFKDYINK